MQVFFIIKIIAINERNTPLELQCTCSILYSMTATYMYIIGDVMISGNVTLTVVSDLNGASAQFTLTCISTGGPATTVTWTRDSVTVTEGIETVLDDPVTAQYTHTLTVTGRLGGLYTCTVANNKPSSDSADFTVQGTCVCGYGQLHVAITHFHPSVTSAPSGLTAVQDGLTSILVSWSPPDPLGDTTGYRIDYTDGSSSDSVTVDDGSTNSYHLTGLQINGESLHIAIIATSSHFFSLPMEVMSTTLRKIWGGFK